MWFQKKKKKKKKQPERVFPETCRNETPQPISFKIKALRLSSGNTERPPGRAPHTDLTKMGKSKSFLDPDHILPAVVVPDHFQRSHHFSVLSG
jgi:hypothetical protein